MSISRKCWKRLRRVARSTWLMQQKRPNDGQNVTALVPVGRRPSTSGEGQKGTWRNQKRVYFMSAKKA